MEEKQYSPAFLRRRKFLLLLPVFLLPFVTLLAWTVDNLGKDDQPKAEKKGQHGLNRDVPNARLKNDSGEDKLAFYDEAEMDSIKERERIRGERVSGGRLPDSVNGLSATRDTNEERVNRKLKELSKVLDSRHAAVSASVNTRPARPFTLENTGVDRLEKMMQSMKDDKGDNPEMREMDAVLEKLLRVQHPEWARDSLRAVVSKAEQAALPVERATGELVIPAVDAFEISSNRFYSLDDTALSSATAAALEAEVPERLVLVNGATVKLKLLQAVRIGNATLAAGSFIYGVAGLNGERLMVAIHSVRCGETILPVDLRVYDFDGLEGIYIPGAISRDVVKQSADQGINSLGLGIYDPSVGGQATQAGIQLAKGLMSRKVRQVRVTVEAGYRLLLKDYSRRS